MIYIMIWYDINIGNQNLISFMIMSFGESVGDENEIMRLDEVM